MDHGETKPPVNDPPQRRSFLVRLSAIVTGGVLLVFPFVASWGVIFHPLRRGRTNRNGAEHDAARFVRICPLDALPADGTPREFAVTAAATDAWTRTPGQRIGSIFLERTDSDGKPRLTAFTTTCPHLGCAVEFDAPQDRFTCPCHESAFARDGKKLFGPSLRGLDPLDTKLVDENGTPEVWVDFQRFRAGIAERIPIG